MITISRRTQNLKPSPTLALAAKAKELASQGRDIISLSVGEPDWDTTSVAVRAGVESIEKGFTKYTPANGIPELRKAIADQVNGELATQFTPNQVTVSAGAKFIVFSALQALCDPGDEVIIPAPYWVSYPTMAELAEGVPVIPQTTAASKYKLTAEGLSRVLTAKSKVLILNSPSNPTGEYYNLDELKAIAEVLRKFPRVAVLSDDIYNRLVFDGVKLAPHILQAAPDFSKRTVLVNGASKTFSMTGWRIGWALGPDNVISAMNNYQSQSASCASSFGQKATLAAILEGGDEVARSVKDLEVRRNFAYERLSSTPSVKVSKPPGAFYIWPNIAECFSRTYRGQPVKDTSQFCGLLLEHEGVAVVPGQEFGAEGFVRISFALKRERMSEAFDRLARFISELK